MRKLLAVLVGAAMAAAGVAVLPDVKRYLAIRRM